MGATDETLACSWRCRARVRRLWWRREVCGNRSCGGEPECCGYDHTDNTTPSSTSTTAVADTTTLPATTTTVATEDLVKQAVQDYFEAYTVCGTTPATCSPSFTAAEGPSRAVVTEFAQGLVDQGLYFSTDRRGTYLVAESVSLDSPSQATAIYCAHDALIVLGPNGPDGLPTTVNDEITSFRYQYRVS